MYRKAGVALTALLLAAGGSAMAASKTAETMVQCENLIKQFDTVVVKHEKADKIQMAKQLRADAEKTCKAGDYKKGVADMHTALKDIGEKPVQK